ncbi:MAG: AAA family ATPase, partial [Bryobacteraceae bacterium]
YPSREELSRIVDLSSQTDEAEPAMVMDRDEIAELTILARQVIIAPHVRDFAVEIVMATQPGARQAPDVARRYIRYGSSPRGAQALVECGRVLALMRGRLHLSMEDIASVARPVLRHRLILNFDAHADGQTPDTVLDQLLTRAGARD